MLEAAREVLAGEDAWIVGGAIRDELLGKPILDLDIACRDPKTAAGRIRRSRRRRSLPALRAARGLARRATATAAPSTSRRSRTGSRTTSAAATSRSTRSRVRSRAATSSIRSTGAATSSNGLIRAVRDSVFRDDPLRLLRAVRLEDQLGFRIEPGTEELIRRDAALVTRPAGERILGELAQLSARAYPRLAELGLLDAARRLARAARPRRRGRIHACSSSASSAIRSSDCRSRTSSGDTLAAC